LKKLLTLSVLTLSVLFTVTAEAQEFHGAFGFGTVTAPGVTTNSTTGITYPSLSGGLYPSFSGIFILKHHIGFGGQVSWRASRALYTESSFTGLFQAPYRPIFYSFDGVYGRKFNKKIGADVMAGVGGLDLRFYNAYFTCGAFSCTNYTSSNHFAGHFGADIRYYFWGNAFIRPEVHYYLIHNNVEFNGANAARFMISIGYSFMPGF
jgi:hypothetical protein